MATWMVMALSNTAATPAKDWCSKAGRIRTIPYFTLTAKSPSRPIAFARCKATSMRPNLAAAQLTRMLGNVDQCCELEAAGGEPAHPVRRKILVQRSWACTLWRWMGISNLAESVPRMPDIACSRESPRRNERAAWQRRLMVEDFFTGWGIRTVATTEARYNPLSYHNGSVWPHDNSIIASGMAKFGFQKMAGQILLALLDLSDEVELHRLPELFCGLKRRPTEGPTLYPVACSPQAWAAAAPFLILEACLGITVQAERGRIVFDGPFLPEGIPQLAIRNLRCGKATADLLLERRGDSVLVHCENKPEDLEIVTIIS